MRTIRRTTIHVDVVANVKSLCAAGCVHWHCPRHHLTPEIGAVLRQIVVVHPWLVLLALIGIVLWPSAIHRHSLLTVSVVVGVVVVGPTLSKLLIHVATPSVILPTILLIL